MNTVYIPKDYHPPLDIYEMQRAIEFVKSNFQAALGLALNLKRVSAPLIVDEGLGLNDNLNGYERPVSFDVPAIGATGQVVQSLAKWKRLALKRYDFYTGNGLYTDMNAIRRDEELDNIHSIYVDQWDWEKIITMEQRNLDYLKETAQAIVGAICDTSEALKAEFPRLNISLNREVAFITSQELEDMYPDMTPDERQQRFVKDNGTAFIMQIGDKLKSGVSHDGRAPDYDDWSLNGDILFWNEIIERDFEISSMGVRVDSEAMDRQLTLSGCDDRRALPFHRMLLNNELPQTIGGGVGQSRLCMLMIGTAHIGEVQSSMWDAATCEACARAGIMLL